MTAHRYPGGIISAAAPTVTSNSASGVWTVEEAVRYKAAGTWPDGAGTDPYFPYTTMLLHGDGTNGAQNNTFLDGSTNNYTITRSGNATQGSFSPYFGPGNYSIYYGANQCGWQTPASSISSILGSAFNSTATFTAEAWIYPVARHSGGGAVLGYVLGSMQIGGSSVDWSFGPDSNGNLVVFWYQGGNQICKGASIIPLNTWTHIAMSVTSGVIKLFVNGVSETLTGTTTINLSTQAVTYVSSGGYMYAGTTWQGFNGYISNLRVVGKRALYSATFTPSTTPLVATTDTTLLTNNQNSFTDVSGANWTFTLTNANGLPISKFSPFTMYEVTATSYSGYFDGNGDYLTVPSSTAFGVGTGDFTIEYWVYFNSLSGTPTVFDLRSSGADTVISDYYNTSGNPILYYNSANLLTSTGTVIVGSWNHIAWVRSGTTITSYVNGVARGTVTSSANFGTTQPLRIAANIVPGAYLNGSVSNFRFTKGQALYTTGFTPSITPLTTISQGATASNVSLLTCQSTTFIDNSTNAFAITANGNARPRVASPFTDTVVGPTPYTTATYGGSIFLDGFGDYLNLPSGTGFNLLTSDFTIEAWVYPTARVTNAAYIIGQSSYGVGSDFAFWITSTGGLQFYMTTGGSNIVSAATTIPLSAWTHVAISRSGTSFKIFVNGAVDGTLTSSVSITNTYTPTTIGNSTNNTGSVWFPGYISNLRVVKGTALYTAPFVPPTAPVTAVTNTQLLLNGTNGGIIDNTAITGLETVGNAQISTSVVKYGTGSISFDGAGDYLLVNSVSNSGQYSFGSGDFTIEMWIYPTSGTSRMLYDSRPNSSAGLYPTVYINSSNAITYFTNGSDRITGAAPTLNTWQHIAVVRYSGSTKLYINGTQSGSTYVDSNVYSNGSTRPIIGADGGAVGSQNYAGYIDDLRVTNGVARYTTNFTPPTAPFSNF